MEARIVDIIDCGDLYQKQQRKKEQWGNYTTDAVEAWVDFEAGVEE